MKIALIGGSFNPPTATHGRIGMEILKKGLADQVWYVPSNTHPFAGTQDHKKKRAPYEDRCRMVSAMIEDLAPDLEGGCMQVSTIEFSMRGECYTKNVVEALMALHPHHEFMWVVGTDCVKDFPKWKYIEWVLENVTMIVYPRPGYAYEGGLGPKHIILSDVPLVDASSSRVRAGDTSLLTPSVARYWEGLQTA